MAFHVVFITKNRRFASLTALTREDHPFKLNWGTLEQNAFDTLKQAIVAAPMLYSIWATNH